MFRRATKASMVDVAAVTEGEITHTPPESISKRMGALPSESMSRTDRLAQKARRISPASISTIRPR